MLAEESQAVAVRFLESICDRQLDAWDELMHPDIVVHGVLGAVQGSASYKTFLQTTLMSAFPDWHFTIEDVIAAGDKVAVRITESGTLNGRFMGMPPTGRHFTITAVQIMHMRDGKIAEMWGVRDTRAMMQQLGLMPEPVHA